MSNEETGEEETVLKVEVTKNPDVAVEEYDGDEHTDYLVLKTPEGKDIEDIEVE